MRVTVSQLHEDRDRFDHDWKELSAHVREERSDLVLLPEMPFSRWLASAPVFDPEAWEAALAEHDRALEMLPDLAPASVAASRPVERGGRRLNEGFVWEPGVGYRMAHHKRYLPDEEGYWEARWFTPGNGRFDPVELAGAVVAFQICSDLWVPEHGRSFASRGVHLVVTPRATQKVTADRWLVGGKATAIVAGAFWASSNRIDDEPQGFGGGAWVVAPDGRVLAAAPDGRIAVTVEVDLAEAEKAKTSYPRYLK